MPGRVYHQLHELWRRPERHDEYLGTLINVWLAEGGDALGIRAGQQYVDTGTLHGYRSAIRLLEQVAESQPQPSKPPEEAIFTNELTITCRR
jgi:hypothetical protein